LRTLAQANLAEVARLDGQLEEAERLGRSAMIGLAGLGDPGHRRRLLATIGLALADSGRVGEATSVLEQLGPGEEDGAQDGPAAVVEAAIALRRGETKRAAENFARAAEAYDGTHDPRDVVEALVGLIISTPDPDQRAAAVSRLGKMCRSGGIVLLARERERLGPQTTRALLED
jgi:hypothetical protein